MKYSFTASDQLFASITTMWHTSDAAWGPVPASPSVLQLRLKQSSLYDVQIAPDMSNLKVCPTPPGNIWLQSLGCGMPLALPVALFLSVLLLRIGENLCQRPHLALSTAHSTTACQLKMLCTAAAAIGGR